MCFRTRLFIKRHNLWIHLLLTDLYTPILSLLSIFLFILLSYSCLLSSTCQLRLDHLLRVTPEGPSVCSIWINLNGTLLVDTNPYTGGAFIIVVIHCHVFCRWTFISIERMICNAIKTFKFALSPEWDKWKLSCTRCPYRQSFTLDNLGLFQ